MNTSETITKLIPALLKAQGQIKSVKKEKDNPFYKSKYADISDVIEAIKKPLNDNGIVFVQPTTVREDGKTVIETVLIHESGEWMSGTYPVVAPEDVQKYGIAMTYGRRYALVSIMGLEQEDDDGNGALLPTHDTVRGVGGTISTPQVENSIACPEHGVEYQRYEKNGKVWYSHKLADGTYCNKK